MKKRRGLYMAALLVCLVSTPGIAGEDAGREVASSLPPPLAVTTAELPAGMAGVEYCVELAAEGGTPPYAWKAAGELPRGLELDGSYHSLRGIPAAEGAFKFSLTVTDSGGVEAARDFTVKVIADPTAHLPEPTPAPLAITTTELPAARLGREYSASIGAEGGVEPYIWLLSAGALPRGLVLEGTRGALEGVPQLDGEYDFTVAVQDSSGGVTEASYIVEVATARVYITTGLLPDATIGDDYGFALTAVGGSPPYLWAVEEGDLPRGLAIDAETGRIAGVVGESSATWAEGVRRGVEPGLFRVAVTDSLGRGDRAEFRIIVSDGPAAGGEGDEGSAPTPVILGGTGGLPTGVSAKPETAEEEKPTEDSMEEEEEEEEEEKVVVVTDRLPSARLENDYAASLEAAGGSPPYSWSLHGALPAGLSLDGETGRVEGEPTESGEFLVGVQASDSLGAASDVRQVPLLVKEALKPVTDLLAAPSDGKVGIAWVNPADPDFAEAVVLRNRFREPIDPEDGEVAYCGEGDNCVDGGLENGLQYYYAAFAVDSDGYESGAEESSYASARPAAVTLSGECDPFADEVVSFNPLAPGGCFGASCLPGNVLGPPYYNFSAPAGTCEGYVVSLHARENKDNGATAPYGGNVTLKFSDNIVVNGEDADFTVFSNGFYISLHPERMWIEPAVVEVSQDGASFYAFPTNYVEHEDTTNPYSYNSGFAGIWPAKSYALADTIDPAHSGGDQFDLDAVRAKDLKWISYVRIKATGDRWLVDAQGDYIRHTADANALCGNGKSGFDLDAIAAIHY